MIQEPKLIFHSAYRPFIQDEERRIFMSTKFLEVLTIWSDLWPGEVTLLAESAEKKDLYMTEELDIADIPFEVKTIDRKNLTSELFPDKSVILAALEGGLPDLHKFVPNPDALVYYGDASPDIEWQIKKINLKNDSLQYLRFLNAKKYFLLAGKQKLTALKNSAALQSNQFASSDFYKEELEDIMVYIDTRMSETDVVNPATFDKKQKHYLENKPLHLCFSGRMEEIKNPLDLVEVAYILQQENIACNWTIFGDGSLLQRFKDKVSSYHLENVFSFEGFLDLKTGMLPRLSEEIDVFVIPHKQGDPSCTYSETMFAGVPVVSYPNNAIKALHKHFGVGMIAKNFTPEALANEIQTLHTNRQLLSNRALVDYTWGKKQTMENAYSKRVEHLLAVYNSAFSN